MALLVHCRLTGRVPFLLLALLLAWGGAHRSSIHAELPTPDLNVVFPTGVQVGTTVEIAVEGNHLDGVTSLRMSDGRIVSSLAAPNRFRLTVPADLPEGIYDLRVVGKYGVSAPRSFVVSALADVLEVEPNNSAGQATASALDRVNHGRCDKPGDIDYFRFAAKRGQRATLSLWGHRVDSPLHAVLEVFDAAGKRVGVNRGRYAHDPSLEFIAPADGDYVVRIADQTLVGGAPYVYRLEIDTRAPQASLPVWLRAAMAGVASKTRATNEAPEVTPQSDADDNHRPATAQRIEIPATVHGRLPVGDEQDWYLIPARKGEVLWVESFGQRFGAPVDLDIVVLDAAQHELAHFTDQLENLGDTRFPTNHTDAAGRFVAPSDGNYFVMVRNLIGDQQVDERRVYLLSVRRADPDFTLTVLPRRTDHPSATNVWRGGRERVDVLVERRRGCDSSIRLAAADLPAGWQCADTWIGPGESRGIVMIEAARSAVESVQHLQIVGHAQSSGLSLVRPAFSGCMVRAGTPNGWGRLTAEFPVGVVQDAPMTVHAALEQTSHFQGSVVDVAVDLQRRDGQQAPVQVSGVGLPAAVENAYATIPPAETKGWLSFYLPASLPVGSYSFAVQVETQAMVNGQKLAVTSYSQPLTLHVEAERIRLTLDPQTPRKVARGQVVHVKYRAERRNGFIGKIHTELAAPGGVTGVRGRGVTFTGQTETGDIQIIATDNAVPGQIVFLRLEAVGTVEDQPVFRGSRLLPLEITP